MGRILFNALQASTEGAGISRYAFELAYHLSRLSAEVHVVISHEYERDFSKNTSFYFNRVRSTAKRILFEQLVLPFTFDKFSLIHYPDLASPLVCSKPAVVTLHDLCHLRYPHMFTISQKSWRSYMGLLSLKRAKRIICVSEFTKNEAIKILNIPGDKMRVVHSGVRPKNDRFNDKLPSPVKVPYILSVGTLQPRKNFARLIKAFLIMKKRGLTHKLVIAGGKGRLHHLMLNEIKGLDISQVIFTGHVADSSLAALYENADALVCASLYEGFGFPPLEAMSYGTPAVVSHASSLPEVCGDAVCYVDPYDVDDIADGIYKVLTDKSLRNELIQKGFERINFFTWEKAARETLEIYLELQGKSCDSSNS